MNDTTPTATITRTGFTAVRVTAEGISHDFDFKTLASTKKFTSQAWDSLMQRYGRDNVEFIGL